MIDHERLAASAAAIRVCQVLQRYPLQHVSEAELQAEISAALAAAGIQNDREVALSDRRSRIDVLAGRVGIEVKIDGSVAAVNRQLARYALCPEIDALVLVTTRAKHSARLEECHGKPIFVCSLIGGGL